MNARSRVIQDYYVDPEFGTGVVKVTPAHDPNDFEMGSGTSLTQINVMNGDGTMNEQAGPYAGMDRFECRKKLVADLEAAGLIEKIEDHQHAVGHCYRCDTVVEPRLSPQWFVQDEAAGRAGASKPFEDGRIEFVPARWTKVYLEWMENIRDWCISRQIWWGHRIPGLLLRRLRARVGARRGTQECPDVRSGEDPTGRGRAGYVVLVVALAVQHIRVAGDERGPRTSTIRPGPGDGIRDHLLLGGAHDHGRYRVHGRYPVPKVYIHGTVRDDHGRKMSKSLGNSIDPLTIIDEFSADALRFSLMMITATGQDVYLSERQVRDRPQLRHQDLERRALHADARGGCATRAARPGAAPTFDAEHLSA